MTVNRSIQGILRAMYQSKENAGSIPWKSTRTGGGHGEGPRRLCVLEPTRSDSQFLRRSDCKTGKKEALGKWEARTLGGREGQRGKGRGVEQPAYGHERRRD